MTESEPTEAEAYPAQSFSVSLEGLTVLAEAAEGAFPDGTRMEVREVISEELPESVSEAIPPEFLRLQALEFTFLTKTGEAIVPKALVRITVQLEETEGTDSPLVISIDREGNASLVEQADAEGGSRIIFEIGPAEEQE